MATTTTTTTTTTTPTILSYSPSQATAMSASAASASQSAPQHSSNRSTGITHQIRNKLNFNDERLWKKFSGRRLELIDSMSLSEKKASEQDDEILNCSHILMKEFNYDDPSYLPEFIKLVRVAIQSVRRNRKRSTKSTTSKQEEEDEMNERGGRAKKKQKTIKATRFVMAKQMTTPTSEADSSSSEIESESEIEEEIDEGIISEDDDANGFKISDLIKTKKSKKSSPSLTTKSKKSKQHKQFQQQQQQLPINTLLQPVISAHPKNPITRLPSFSSIFVNGENNTSSSSSSSQPSVQDHHHNHHQTPQQPQQQQQHAQDSHQPQQQDLQMTPEPELSLREMLAMNKLLSLIKRSKSCTELSLDLQTKASISYYENLEMLGSTIVLSTISYIFEKFFVGLNPSSVSYLRLKLNNDFTLSKLLKKLDISLNETYYNDFVSAQTFKRLIGCCIKDFGFDEVISPLTDIIHEIILKGYPLISKNSMLNNTPATTTTTTTSTTLATNDSNFASLTSASNANTTTPNNIKVELRLNNRQLDFTFNPQTSSRPNYLELLGNSKDAFHLIDKTNLSLRNLKNNQWIQNDDDVAKIFDNCPDKLVQIGIVTGMATADYSSSRASSPIPTSMGNMAPILTHTNSAPSSSVYQQQQAHFTHHPNTKISSPLDTLSNAANIVEGRRTVTTNNNNTSTTSTTGSNNSNNSTSYSAIPSQKANNTTTINNKNREISSAPAPATSTILVPNEEKIIFQPLL